LFAVITSLIIKSLSLFFYHFDCIGWAFICTNSTSFAVIIINIMLFVYAGIWTKYNTIVTVNTFFFIQDRFECSPASSFVVFTTSWCCYYTSYIYHYLTFLPHFVSFLSSFRIQFTNFSREGFSNHFYKRFNTYYIGFFSKIS